MFQKNKSSHSFHKRLQKSDSFSCRLSAIILILVMVFSLVPSSSARKHYRNHNKKVNQLIKKPNSIENNSEISIQSNHKSINSADQTENQLVNASQKVRQSEISNKCFLNNSPIRANYGVWINLWNYPKNPEKYFGELRENGINTIYLQISRSTTEAIKHPEAVNQIIKSAKEKNIKVIGWMYATLQNPREDAEKFVLGAQIPGLHSMAIDLEENLEPSRLILFSRSARKELGRQYQITAITYNPCIRPIGSKFPWETIAREFDVIAPMIYWNKRMSDPSLVYAESSQAIQSLKELIKDVNGRAKSIHPIGDSHHTSEKEIQAFVQACLKEDVVAESGISLYPSHLASSDLWRALSGVSEK